MPPSSAQRLDRQARRRLAVLHHAGEVTGNVGLTCRYDGISRSQDDGIDGLRDRSSRPRHSPNATHAERHHIGHSAV
ncbi:leucine zipper domain-containing protein [Actinomadura sp. DC4]|uniref:leucine zipper domain-containing protein n=1 Tax=Actinomadura sp. DC4 TaxID=3055069 RepID=UPI0025B20104|nr:leucine zipper domain-containing protein [Actinomadura sp. DC4]MDN3353516.1 leucine zipper domain-containing protein [Actinomadura sp. DC4]